MRITNITLALSCSLMAVLLFSSEQATAQSSESVAGELEEITVTARRKEERLQDTPIAVSAFTTEALEERMIINTEQLDQIVPNLQFTNDTTLAGNNSSSNIFIRGVGQTDPTSTVDPGVGLYIDDVYMGQSVGGSLELRDIAGVQVLRGPQGTLFGKNSVGGAILLTTQEPGDDFGGDLRVGVGSDSMTDLFVAFDAPISDTVKSRFSFGARNQDGYVTRVQTGEDLGDTSTWTIAGKIVFEPSDTFSGKFQFDYTENDENGNPFVFAASNEAATFQRVASQDAGCPGVVFPTSGPVPPLDDERCANDFQNKGPYANNGTYPIESILTNWGASLHLQWELSDTMDFKSITALRSLNWEGIRDADNTPLSILHTDYDSDGDQFSQEFQLTYNTENVSGTMGLFYFEEEVDDIVFVQLNIPPPGVEEDSDNNVTENDNWALFTQWTFNASDRLALTLGARYTEDTKGSTPDQFNYANPDFKYLPVQLYEKTFTNTSGAATVSYRWNESAMTYVSYSEAFKGGGWNSHFNRPQTQAEIDLFHSFGPEEAQTVELGFKFDLANNTFRLNGAIFSTDYEDLQFTYRVGVAPYLANAGKASIDGYELEATWVPSENWTIQAGLGALDSSVDDLNAVPPGAGIGVNIGNVLPYSPDLQANVGIGYSGMLGNGWFIAPRVDFFYQDKTFWDANNTLEISQPTSFTVLNVGVELGPDQGPWAVRAFVANATDELYATGGNSSLTTGSGYAEIAYARPRQYYLTFTYDW